jgi:hypothetical protein
VSLKARSLSHVHLKPPFEKVTILRPRAGLGKQIGRASHPGNAIALMNAPMKYEPPAKKSHWQRKKEPWDSIDFLFS